MEARLLGWHAAIGAQERVTQHGLSEVTIRGSEGHKSSFSCEDRGAQILPR